MHITHTHIGKESNLVQWAVSYSTDNVYILLSGDSCREAYEATTLSQGSSVNALK